MKKIAIINACTDLGVHVNGATCQEIDDFVQEFNRLLLAMHELHFEEKMSEENTKLYQKRMHDLVLSVKALDTKNEKRNLEQINEFNQKLYYRNCF